MNSLVLLAIALCLFALAYRYYASFIAAKVLVLVPEIPTPAHSLKDGKDYVPMNRIILFGHHFAAIAGAGPLIGPVLAAQYGYLPGALWILLGAVFAGGVHDMITLFGSVRTQGKALHIVARRLSGSVTGIATAMATFFIIIVALAGLAIVVVNALKDSSWSFFTIAMTIPIAVFMGLYMFRFRPGKIWEASIIGVILLLAAVLAGPLVSDSSLGSYLSFPERTVKLMLPVYGFFAAALPVWLLLAPRDYLSTYMKIGTVLLLALGIVWVHPYLNMPAITPYIRGGGPIVPGPVWPYVCITIACGAISGFHSLITSGTTPKMLDNERDITGIAYGAMLVEGIVGILALIAATALTVGDYFAINTGVEAWKNLGLQVIDLPILEKEIQENLMNRPGGAVSLAVGMAYIFGKIPWLSGIMKYWYHFAIMFEALFVLTTIDAGTRVARYIMGEILGSVYKPFATPSWIPGTIICSAAVSFFWGYLLYEGEITTIWPMFGVANQLLAALALALGTTMLLKKGKKRYGLITLVPFSFLSVTVITAAVMNIVNIYLPKGDWTNASLSIAVLVLVGIVIMDSLKQWAGLIPALWSKKRPGFSSSASRNPVKDTDHF
jgi:carbon starvation protein